MPESGERRTVYDPYCREHGHSPYQYREGFAPTTPVGERGINYGPSMDALELRPEPEPQYVYVNTSTGNTTSYTHSWVEWDLSYEITEGA